jgi:excisionase family DNA binding protein
MRRLSLSDWYRYLESQFVEGERVAQGEQPPSQPVSAPPEPLDRAQPTSHAEDETASTQLAPASSEPPTQPAMPAEQETPRHEPPFSRAQEAYALVSLRIPDFLAFVPLLREELGLPAPEGKASGVSESPLTPTLSPLVKGREGEGSGGIQTQPKARLRKHRHKQTDPEQLIPPEMDEIWAKLPRYLRYLAEWSDDSVTDKYYPVRGRESREELIARLTDPVLSLEEVARLLGVCPATVRRYTNRGWLRHFRTEGNQRRFRLSDIVAFLEEQTQRVPGAPSRAKRGQGRRSKGAKGATRQ